MDAMSFTLVTIIKALIEVAGFSLLGQGVLYLFAGASRERNFVYLMFKAVTAPVFKLTRFVTPRFILDRHIWILTPLVLMLLWTTVTYFKIRIALEATGRTVF
jgi:hypothetical protein